MLIRKILPLLFSTIIVLAVPTIGQQSNPPSNAQSTPPTDQSAPASASQSATGHEPLEEKHGNFWQGDEPGIASLVLHPFANKAYVQRQLQPIRDRLNELDELTAANSKMVKDVDTNSQHGIQLASEKANEADSHASDAASKAQNAQASANQANTRAAAIEGTVGNIDPYKSTNQIELRFRPGQRELSEDSKRALDDLATSLKDQRGYVIELKGYSRGRGQTAISASRQMADSVARYLVINREVPAYRIYVQPMGAASVSDEKERTEKSNATRVEVTVLKNDIDKMASTSGASTSPK
jgi:outer membrane protein OmpA-like peptidoglycan-associated protein